MLILYRKKKQKKITVQNTLSD